MARTSVPKTSAHTNIIQLKVTLRGVSFGYTYDFGDNWERTIALENSDIAVEGKFYPACSGGKRNCPPEDCGGAWGYERLLAILADPNHPEYADQIDWIGGEFDPN